MPVWLINLLVSLAIKVGLPYLLKAFPWIPQEVMAIINKLIEDLKDPKLSNSVSRKKALAKVRKQLQVSPDAQGTKKI